MGLPRSAGRWLATSRRADAALAEASAQLALREPAIAGQVEHSLSRLRLAAALEESARIATDLAARQREQAFERYRLGIGSIVETLQAEALARQAERVGIAARFARPRAWAELEQAIGASLDPETPCDARS